MNKFKIFKDFGPNPSFRVPIFFFLFSSKTVHTPLKKVIFTFPSTSSGQHDVSWLDVARSCTFLSGVLSTLSSTWSAEPAEHCRTRGDEVTRTLPEPDEDRIEMSRDLRNSWTSSARFMVRRRCKASSATIWPSALARSEWHARTTSPLFATRRFDYFRFLLFFLQIMKSYFVLFIFIYTIFFDIWCGKILSILWLRVYFIYIFN